MNLITVRKKLSAIAPRAIFYLKADLDDCQTILRIKLLLLELIKNEQKIF